MKGRKLIVLVSTVIGVNFVIAATVLLAFPLSRPVDVPAVRWDCNVSASGTRTCFSLDLDKHEAERAQAQIGRSLTQMYGEGKVTPCNAKGGKCMVWEDFSRQEVFLGLSYGDDVVWAVLAKDGDHE